MYGDSRDVEIAEAAEAFERERRLQRIRQELEGAGEAYWVDCGDPIDVARRLALPSARRCVTCQSALERRHR